MGFEQRITKAPAAEKFTTIMQNTLAQTKANLKKAQERMKVQADKYRSIAPKCQISNKVWLSTNNLKVTCASKKLTEQWLGQYDITKLVGDNTVWLCLPKTMHIHLVVNISHVWPYKELLEEQTSIWSGPVKVTEDREIEYEVDHIFDVWKKGQHMEYLIHWKVTLKKDHTWEPKGNLGNTKAALDLFHKRNPWINLQMMFSEPTKLYNPYEVDS